MNLNKQVVIGVGEQRVWQRDTDWDVDAECPHRLLVLPAVAPGLSSSRYPGSFPMRVNTQIYTVFLVSVYNHTLIPINLLLVGNRVMGGSSGGFVLEREAAEGG